MPLRCRVVVRKAAHVQGVLRRLACSERLDFAEEFVCLREEREREIPGAVSVTVVPFLVSTMVLAAMGATTVSDGLLLHGLA